MRRQALKFMGVATLTTLCFGCGADELLVQDTNAFPGGAPPDLGRVAAETTIFESFDNQQNVASWTGGALLDVNQGVLTLPRETIPTIDGYGTDMFRGRVEHNGLVEAEEIVVEEMGSLEASDAVEMRAIDTVQVIGDIRAGRGGVTIVGGRGVYITGSIDSRGPVRILVESPEGEIVVAGRISVRASTDDLEENPPHVELLGRGSVKITGEIESAADEGRPGGDLRVQVYGPVEVQGALAHLSTHADGTSEPGTIRLRSEQSITIAGGAQIGAPSPASNDADLVLGGNVEIQATHVRIEDGAWIEAGTGMVQGGGIFVAAGEALAVDGGSMVRSGAGAEGGSLILKARRIGIGQASVLAAGQGRSYGAHFEIDAVESLDIVDESQVVGGPTECGPGGAVRVRVAGSLRVRAGARLSGGTGAIALGTDECEAPSPGGDVLVFAHAVDAAPPAIQAGRGYPAGNLAIELDETLSVEPPNLTVGTAGEVISHPLDRGQDALGRTPRLVSSAIDAPEGTAADVWLCGDDAPSGAFEVCADVFDPAAMQALSPHRYLRYEVRLVGRVYDAPVIDYFEIDLAP